jgi:Mg2+-importing ATPase
LKLANVALVVDQASDIARDAADIVLLNKSLAVIINGIKSGRAVFANTIKYLKITLISNFGNFYAIAIASLLVDYLPMLPVQILLLNLLSDFPMIAIATDKVDSQELRRPRTYNVREVVLIAIILGLVSTIFDFIFFAVFKHYGASTLQTCWFMGSVLTELLLIYSIRTRLAFWRAKAPSLILGGLSVIAIAVTLIIPYLYIGNTLFKFMRPSLANISIILGIILAYFVITEVIKRYYYYFTLNFDKIIKK